MDSQCAKCGGECCKGAMFATTLGNQAFLLQTRNVKAVAGGVIVPCRCRYLTQDGKCSIYAVRPEACKQWTVDGYGCRIVREAAQK